MNALLVMSASAMAFLLEWDPLRTMPRACRLVKVQRLAA